MKKGTSWIRQWPVAVVSLLLSAGGVRAEADWRGLAVPAEAGAGKRWELQEGPSDDFNYVCEATAERSDFGSGKWYNFYHNNWDGPGTTYWQHDHVEVDGEHLVIRASRNPSTKKMGVPGVNAGCVTGHHRVGYPVFVEAAVSVANIALASDVWLLSPDDTQELDIIECYGGAGSGNGYFAEFIHLSHHSFIRKPFQDYQPRDRHSWWKKEGILSWGTYCWNGGDRKFVRVGIHWISPFHFEYYIDGERVRVLYHHAVATRIGETWHYTHPTMKDGKLLFEGGYQKMATFEEKQGKFSFQTLKQASEASPVSIIDPYNFQNGRGMDKDMDIIINIESQNWHVADGRTPEDSDLADPTRNRMLVDWIRVYKPVPDMEEDETGR